jgi:hypothetical protein
MSNVLPDLNEQGYLPEGCYLPPLTEFVERFVQVDDINKRKELFSNYQSYSGRFKSILLKVWIGGSYVTEKPKPNDIDLTVHYDTMKFNDLKITPLAERLNFSNKEYMGSKYNCHTQYVPVYPKNHPKYVLTERQNEKWYKWFTRDRNGISKGIVELENNK